MRLSRIDIQAFGCLSDVQMDLAPGLNVVFGPNEAGKSTLRRAVLALLYGFYTGETVKRKETALHQLDRPWSDTRYRASLSYVLQNGSEFRVQRDFTTTDVATSVWDLAVGKDVTDEFGRGRRGNVPFMTRHLGMPKEVFETCALVSQGELFEIVGENKASPQQIGDTIVSLADTGRRDVSARLAIDRLEKVLKEQVGTERARTTALPLARNRLRESQVELEAIKTAQEELAREAEELRQADESCRGLRDEIGRTAYLVASVEGDELQKRIEGLGELEERRKEVDPRLAELAPLAAFPAEERERIRQQASRLADLRVRIEGASGAITRQRERISELQAQGDALSPRQEELAPLADFPVERKPEIDRLVAGWRSALAMNAQARSRWEAARVDAEHLVDECAALEREVGSLTHADRERLLSHLQGAEGARPARIVVLVAVALVRLLLAGPRLLVRLVSAILGRRTGPPAAGGDDAVTPSGDPAEVLQNHSRYQEIAPLVRRLRDERSSAEETERAVVEGEQRARLALSGVLGEAAGIEDAYGLFCEKVRLAGEVQAVRIERQGIENERKAVAEAIDAHQAEVERAGALEAGLLRDLGGLLSRSGPLSELLEDFEQACEQREAHDSLKRELNAMEEKRGLLLGRYSLPELEEMRAGRRREIERLLAEHPHLSGAGTSEKAQTLRSQRDGQQAELQALEVKMAELRTAIDARLRGLRPRAEVEEEIECHSRDVESLDRFGHALSVAIEVAGEAMRDAHRNFAPRVGKLLGEGLERVTEGRYVHAFLDPATFRVTTEVPETGRLEDVESLSQGTRAAAYVLLRVGLAQHMSSISEPVPILLDDPFVDLDGVRLERFLDLLVDLSGEAQILLFTKDTTTRDWFQRTCAGSPGHALTEIGRARVAVGEPRTLL